MRHLLTGFIIFFTATTYGMDKNTLEISKVYAEPNAGTREMVLNRTDYSETLYVDTNAAITDQDISEAKLVDNDYNRIRITFNDEGKKKLAKITKKNIGKRLAIILGDQLVIAPNVSEEILGGTLDITGNFSRDLAEKLILAIRNKKK